MIPLSLTQDSVSKTLRLINREFLKRLNKTGDWRLQSAQYEVHQGKADDTTMPDADVGIWLQFRSLLPDTSAPMQADGFFSEWDFQFVIRDLGNDPKGYDQDKAFEVVGGVIRVITESMGDVSLSGAVDDLEFMLAEMVVGRPAGANRNVAELLLRVRAMHPFLVHDR